MTISKYCGYAALLALGFGLFAIPSTSTANTLTLPLNAADIATFLAEQNNPTVESFLAALPTSLSQSFVLMHESRSMQQATPRLPRQILFGSDARFLLAVSGVPEDPRYNELEFAEFEQLIEGLAMDMLEIVCFGRYLGNCRFTYAYLSSIIL